MRANAAELPLWAAGVPAFQNHRFRTFMYPGSTGAATHKKIQTNYMDWNFQFMIDQWRTSSFIISWLWSTEINGTSQTLNSEYIVGLFVYFLRKWTSEQQYPASLVNELIDVNDAENQMFLLCSSMDEGSARVGDTRQRKTRNLSEKNSSSNQNVLIVRTVLSMKTKTDKLKCSMQNMKFRNSMTKLNL